MYVHQTIMWSIFIDHITYVIILSEMTYHLLKIVMSLNYTK
jgi:hypothetical protein